MAPKRKPVKPPHQIRSSADKAKALAYMNAKHAVVSDGGRTIVLTEDVEAARVERSTFRDIEQLYSNYKELGEDGKWQSLGRWWLAHAERRQYAGVEFRPGGEVREGYFNTWRGFAVEPKEGDWSLYRAHILDNVCQGNEDLYDYVLAWMAHGIQKPEEKPGVALVLQSEERGTGKTVFASTYRELFGPHGIEISNPEHLTGKFNAHLRDCCVVVLSEAFWTGNRRAESVLKSLITDSTTVVEAKGVDVKSAPSYIRVIMTSNSEQVVPAGLDERRYCVLDVGTEHQKDHEYFARIASQMKSGGLAAMLYDLQRHVFSVDVRCAPQTEALLEQKIGSLDAKQKWWYEKLVSGHLLPGDTEWIQEAERKALHEDYCEVVKTSGRRWDHKTATELGKFLHRMLGSALKETRKGDKREYFYVFPALARCRALFDAKIGWSCKWPEADQGPAERPRLQVVARA